MLVWAGLWNQLRVDWTINDQYQYGWFVPPLALALLALRWMDRPAPRPGRLTAPGVWIVAGLAGLALFCLLPLRLIEVPNPDWRLIFWVHAGILTALSLGLAAWCGGWPWVRHFAFPVGFLLLAVPWPSGLEQDIVQGLMRGVAAIAAELMNVMAIPAEAQGNLIRVRGQLVGVDEACSGIRSLQTMLMGGCLLGELSRLSVPRRFALLGGGLLVAMVANIFRSSLLVWLAAEHGVATLEKYHDLAGISVLLIVFGGLLWINARLARGPRPAAPLPDEAPAVPPLAALPPSAFRPPPSCWRWCAGSRASRSAPRPGTVRARLRRNPACRVGRSCHRTARPGSRPSASTTGPRACCVLIAAFPPVGPGPMPTAPPDRRTVVRCSSSVGNPVTPPPPRPTCTSPTSA